jgi:hypothetical protein
MQLGWTTWGRPRLAQEEIMILVGALVALAGVSLYFGLLRRPLMKAGII